MTLATSRPLREGGTPSHPGHSRVYMNGRMILLDSM